MNKKKWITTLALEAETAIYQVPILEQDHVRHRVKARIKNIDNVVASGSGKGLWVLDGVGSG